MAGLVVCSDAPSPDGWSRSDGSTEANLGHVPGWSCEVRATDLVLLNPLGEGLVRAPVPNLSDAWLENVRHDGSCALFLAPSEAESGFAELTIASAAATDGLVAATVRTSVSPDFGAAPKLGRNQPCHCGSGKKFKHCHG